MLTSKKSVSVLLPSDDDKNIIFENGTLLGEINSKHIVSQVRTTNENFNENFNHYHHQKELKNENNSSFAIDTCSIINDYNQDNDNVVDDDNNENSVLMIIVDNNDGDSNQQIEQSLCTNIDNDIHHSGSNYNDRIMNTTITSQIMTDNNNHSLVFDELLQQQSNNVLNTSTCSHESKQSNKRSRRKLNNKKYLTSDSSSHYYHHHHYGNRLPPQYAAVYLDAGNQTGGILPPTSLTSVEGHHVALSVPVIQRYVYYFHIIILNHIILLFYSMLIN